MLDIKELTSKVKSAMKAFMDWNKDDTTDCSVVIETDFKYDVFEKTENPPPRMSVVSQSSDLYALNEFQNYIKIKDELEAAIQESCQRDFHCQIILPQTLTSRVSEDIVRMSLSEPCGVRGCAIYITIQDKGKSYPLSTIYGNASTPPTFEIHLTLREDTCGWRRLQKAFLHVKGCITNSTWKFAPKILRSSYLLEKRKLYRSASSSEENVHRTLEV